MALPSYSSTDIVNQALYAMGELEIDDLATNTSKRAKVMQAAYERIQFFCLANSDWRFATWSDDISVTGGTPPETDQWLSAYDLPDDLVKALFVEPPIRYEIMGDFLLANENQDLQLHYIREVAETAMPPHFVDYFVAELVVRTKKGITGDDVNAADRMMRDNAFVQAEAIDQQQQPNKEPLPSPFIDIRF